MKQTKKGRGGATTRDELSRYKELSDVSLPKVTNPTIKSELISGMAKKSAKDVRKKIQVESEKTAHLIVEETNLPEADDIYVGMHPLQVERYIEEGGGVKRIIETFELEEKLSSDQNMAGDVYKATRTWDGEEYGTVVLKTLKKKHLDGSAERLRSLMADADTEIANLHRFKGCKYILQPTGEPFMLKDGRVVAQMEYLPRSFNSYLVGIENEDALTKAILCGGIQILRAINLIKNKKTNEAPDGWTYIDMKESNLGMDLIDDEWMIKLLDLDSIVPTGPRKISHMRYTPKYVDPEKLMLLHKPGIGLLADPSETIYALGLTLLYAVAKRINVNAKRVLNLKELIGRHHEEDDSSQRISRVSIYEADSLKKEIEEYRRTDKLNLMKVFYLNEALRMMEDNIGDIYTGIPEINRLIRDYRGELIGKSVGVHPCVFQAIRECLRVRSERADVVAMAWRFNDILEKYSRRNYED